MAKGMALSHAVIHYKPWLELARHEGTGRHRLVPYVSHSGLRHPEKGRDKLAALDRFGRPKKKTEAIEAAGKTRNT